MPHPTSDYILFSNVFIPSRILLYLPMFSIPAMITLPMSPLFPSHQRSLLTCQSFQSHIWHPYFFKFPSNNDHSCFPVFHVPSTITPFPPSFSTCINDPTRYLSTFHISSGRVRGRGAETEAGCARQPRHRTAWRRLLRPRTPNPRDPTWLHPPPPFHAHLLTLRRCVRARARALRSTCT